MNPLIAFRTFQSSSHTGAVIAAWKTNMMTEWGLHAVRSIRLWTEDGASNNIKSSKILGASSITCGPHDFQRANLFALGMAGASSQNPAAKGLVDRMSKQSRSFHSSGVASSALQDAQAAIARNLSWHRPFLPLESCDRIPHLNAGGRSRAASRRALSSRRSRPTPLAGPASSGARGKAACSRQTSRSP